MKLSEAIRKGCQGTLQAQGRYYEKRTGALCALGAARKAFGDKPEEMNGALINNSRLHSLLFDNERVNPATKKNFTTEFKEKVFSVIQDLNDTQRWTREAIADWLEGEGL